jgi:menaquinone-dependent protoporphyrinogen oxidase
MRVLIATASKHGATHEIAERMAGVLRSHGLDPDVADVTTVATLDRYEAVVICSAVYYGHWMKPAAEFVRAHVRRLAELRVWLCSSGPLGGEALPEAAEVAEFMASIHPEGSVTFGGALDAAHLGLAERLVVKGVHAPYGDFRDWPAIEMWAAHIADQLSTVAMATAHIA